MLSQVNNFESVSDLFNLYIIFSIAFFIFFVICIFLFTRALCSIDKTLYHLYHQHKRIAEALDSRKLGSNENSISSQS